MTIQYHEKPKAGIAAAAVVRALGLDVTTVELGQREFTFYKGSKGFWGFFTGGQLIGSVKLDSTTARVSYYGRVHTPLVKRVAEALAEHLGPESVIEVTLESESEYISGGGW